MRGLLLQYYRFLIGHKRPKGLSILLPNPNKLD